MREKERGGGHEQKEDFLFHSIISSSITAFSMAAEPRWVLVDGDANDDDGYGLEWGGVYSGSDDDDQIRHGPNTAGSKFVKYMVGLLCGSTLSARTFCIIMYYATLAGIKDAEKYGLKPGSQTGKFSRKVKKVLGWEKRTDRFYEMDVPGHGKHDISRTTKSVGVIPAHEQMSKDFQDDDVDVGRAELQRRKWEGGDATELLSASGRAECG